jgi:ribosomal protein L22
MKQENKLKRKLLLLSLLLTLSWNCFSQTDTLGIRLKPSVAKEIIKDLIKGDELEKENKILSDLIAEYKNKNFLQDQTILNINTQIGNYKEIIAAKDSQIISHKKISETYQKAYRKEKVQRKVWQVVGITGTTLLLLL